MRCSTRHILPIILIASVSVLLGACSGARHVPAGSFLLDKVKVVVEDSSTQVKSADFRNYIQQNPNHSMLWTWKMQLGVYNISGKDTTKWYNRWLRRIGEAPVIYDSAMAVSSAAQLQRALNNRGYMEARVDLDTMLDAAKRKAVVTYRLNAGEPHRIKSIDYQFPNDTLRQIVMQDSAHFTIRPGDRLDSDRLEAMREEICTFMRNRGYYAFGKEFITFNADTTAGSKDVDLTVTLNPPYAPKPGQLNIATHQPYRLRNVYVVTRYNALEMERLRDIQTPDTLHYNGLTILCDKHPYLRPSVIYENCFLKPGALFRQLDVNRTYDAYTRLSILKFINIRLLPVAASVDGVNEIDAYILLSPDKSQSIAFELEGTNSEGDLGVAAGITYSHRNVGKGSETLDLKLRGAYESLSGNLSGLLHDRYLELSADAGITFPKFKFPFLRESFKRKIRASTIFNLSLNYQERPEYTRIISTAGWSYRWSERLNNHRHTFTLVDVNYVYLPESTNDFINQIAPNNPLLRYSYEDHFIMRMGYRFYTTNKRAERPWTRGLQSDIFTLRVNAEVAGNLLFALSSIFDHRPDFHERPYKVFGIRYSQYFKTEGDYVLVHLFDLRNSLAFHAGAGIIIPYGNSTIAPFEKRFYGGGASGVRGWSVRTLGPGSYRGSSSVSDFINQCGDIRLDLSLEYRVKLFWIIELGLFADAGNIWTIHEYANQPGGMFKFNKFYKEIAASYGLGIRLDFTYFLVRFDMGMKAHNPAEGEEPWPIVHPRWGRDSSFHFSIGYPF